QLLLDHDISGLPVVDEEGRLRGIVTEADLVSKEAYGYRRRSALGLLADYLRGHDPQWAHRAPGRTASQLMIPVVDTARPGEDVRTVARRMLQVGRKRLPVVDEENRVVGVLSRRDLLRPMVRDDEAIRSDVVELLSDPFRSPEGAEVAPTVTDGVVTLRGTVRWQDDAEVIERFIQGIAGVVGVDDLLKPTEASPRPVRPY
ncbi:MAG TPA: CBS domain-containing protein, partial [Acidimicrobiales bacterium]|nr:CBS domain-containing protein [Acidimicrobiales bacterium]